MKTRCLLVFAGAVALAVLITPGQTPSQEQTIIYEHSSSPFKLISDIYSINADGTNVKALTNDGHSHAPSWSPDGRRILFIHDSALLSPLSPHSEAFDHDPVELYFMNRDGSDAHLMRRLEPLIASAAWSPDGKTIAVTAVPPPSLFKLQTRRGIQVTVLLLSADGAGEPRFLFRHETGPASWSPDGKKLAFSVITEESAGTFNPQTAIHTVSADGTGEVSLIESGGSPHPSWSPPAWSPNGERIAFERVGSIFVVNTDGSGLRALAFDPEWDNCAHVSWSPDGRQIAFSCAKGGTCGGNTLKCDRRIFVIPADNPPSQLKPLVDSDGAAPVFAPLN